MDHCLLWVLCLLSGRNLCERLITRPEESYRLWCVVVCDLETSWMRRPWPTGAVAPKTNNVFVYVISPEDSNEEKHSVMRRNECVQVFKIKYLRIKIYKWPTNAHLYLWCVLFKMFSAACFGRYSGHLQGDVIITRIKTVQIWLIVSPSLHNN